MRPTVSIIVPVYNAEKFLRRCVDSILNQEYQDYELLLIDDGSQDASGAICDEYAARDSRVRVTHKENTGVSDSRNLAISQAQGTYLQFLDSDDWITSDATRLLVSSAAEHHCDLVISDFYRVVGERVSHKGDIEEDGVMTQEEFAAHMMENPADFYYGVLWNKLYRRELVERYGLRMDTDISWCEDFMFNLEYIRHAQIFYALKAPIYYYVKTRGSLVSQGTSFSKVIKMKLMVFEYYNNFYKHVLDEEDYEKNRLQVYRFFLDAARDGTVPPVIISDSQKLGEERAGVCPEAVAAEGAIMDAYRDRKLMEHYLEVVALKNGLSLTETTLLLYLSQQQQPISRKELADYTNMTRSRLSAELQKLISKKMVKVDEVRSGPDGERRAEKRERKEKKAEKSTEKRAAKKLVITLLPAAQELLPGLSEAQNQYEEARFAGFSEDEVMQYAFLSEKIKKNIQKIL